MAAAAGRMRRGREGERERKREGLRSFEKSPVPPAVNRLECTLILRKFHPSPTHPHGRLLTSSSKF